MHCSTVFLPLLDSFFSSKQSKNLDPSDKTDLYLWDCLGMGKIRINVKLHRIHLVTLVILAL